MHGDGRLPRCNLTKIASQARVESPTVGEAKALTWEGRRHIDCGELPEWGSTWG